jgi:hypothetical protein
VYRARRSISGKSTDSRPAGQARLIATRRIPADTEIRVNYISEQWTDVSATRIAALQAQWHFVCTCEGCHPAAQAQIDAGERNSARSYHATLLNPAAGLSVLETTRPIDRLHTHVHTSAVHAGYLGGGAGSCVSSLYCTFEEMTDLALQMFGSGRPPSTTRRLFPGNLCGYCIYQR